MDLDQFRYYTRWHDHANERTYEAPADPWEFLWVDPGGIEACTGEIPLNWGLGRVRGGDWDRPENREDLTETVTYRGLVQRFEEGYDWEETDLYEWAKEQFDERDTVRGYESLEEFRRTRCGYLDDLYGSIDEEGYRPNEAAGHEMADEDNAFEDAYANHLEPMVSIARDGDVLWCEGYHRLILSGILGVEEIPTYVLCRHERWQGIRDEVAGGADPGDPDVDPDHPDLRDLL